MSRVNDLDAAADQPTPGTPWWMQAVYRVGFPAAIAGWLVWFLTTVVAGQAKTTLETLQAHVVTTQAAEIAQQAERAKQLLLLELICRNTAQTQREADQCNVVSR